MTPDEAKYLALALDALGAVKAWPEHAPSWWRLTGSGVLAGDAKTRVAGEVESFQPRSAQARWFRLSALHTLTGNQDYLAQMGWLAAELPGTDRWMSFAMFVWWEGISLSADRAALRKLLLDTGVPGLLGTIGERLAAGAAEAPGRCEELRRVAIVAQHLSTGAHAGTAITFNLRAVLERAGVQTQVVSPQELSLPEMRGYSAFAQAVDMPPPQVSTWKLRIPGDASIVYSDPRFSIAARWKSIARQIGGFQPDVILFVGLWSPLVWLLRQSFPVLGLSLHAMPPLAPVDVWLAADTGDDSHWPGLPAPQKHPFPFRFWPSQPGDAASRSAIEVPQEAMLMVTTGHRLSVEMPADWCAGIVALLEEHPGLHWLLVGLQPQHHAKFAALHGRVRVLPAQEDLAAWIKLCDLYVNPPRVGGGASIAIAMDLGVPVVSFAGSDGGDKIGDLAVRSPEAWRARLDQWLGDAALRRQAGAQLQAKFRDELDLSTEEASRRLLQGCQLAQRCFHARQTASQAQ